MSIEKKLLGTTPVSGAVDPEGVSFDGTNDYLSRSSDLTGNSDGNVFTFSAWVYLSSNTWGTEYLFSNSKFDVYYGYSHNEFSVYSRDSSGTVAAYVTFGDGVTYSGALRNSWHHLSASIDLSDTNKRHVYIDDEIPVSVVWGDYTNVNIGFTTVPISVGKSSSSNYFPGRIAHVFLDYTYRDLSTESNRRLFIDSDGKPSSTIPSSPILYLPMTDAATAGSNSGTGGDFTVNGVLDTAGRAPNQWNCSASEFDGTNDYLETTALSVPADNKLLTFSYWYKVSPTLGPQALDFIDASDPTNIQKLCLRLTATVANPISFTVYNGIDMTAVVRATYALPNSGYTRGQSHCIQISLDTSDTNKRHAIINGIDVTSSTNWSTYNNLNIPWSIATKAIIGNGFNYIDFIDGSLGEYWVDSSYTDLATSNPFWDSDTNKPKPVRQVISETGTTPLIALPLRGNDAGNNLGSGGDFTVNSGPFTGARGGSEFWARSANFDGALGTGLQNSDSIASDTKTYTYLISFKKDSATGTGALLSLGSASTAYMHFWTSSSGGSDYHFTAYGNQDGFGSAVYQRRSDYNSTSASDTWYTVLGSIDLNNAKDHMYLNGSNQTRASTNFNNAYIESSNITQQTIGARNSVREDGLDGDVVVHYFSTDYIDFSQESNRNLFVDQLGYPKDLTPAIEAGTIADPLIYMKFDDTSALGTNSGTGGNFTVNGTVTAGADVDPNA